LQHLKIRGFWQVNLHAPGYGRTTTHKSPAGAFGIPEIMPPIRRQIFKVMPKAADPQPSQSALIKCKTGKNIQFHSSRFPHSMPFVWRKRAKICPVKLAANIKRARKILVI